MHYINGREAKTGDSVIVKSSYGAKEVYAGVLHSLVPSATSCNGQVAVPIPGGIQNRSVTLGTEVVHAEDAFAALVPTEAM